MNNYFTLEELKEEVYKCSKCALCKQVCPAYKRTKNEALLSKGRCIILSGIINNEMKLNKRYMKTFEECLDCGKCKDFCPSSIDMEKISKSVINYYYDKHKIQKKAEEFIYKITKGKYGRKP